MVYSFVTYSIQGKYFILTFEDIMEDATLVIKFLSNVTDPFDQNKINLPMIKMRDPEVILYQLEEYGMTIILKGLQ